jgi:glucose/arabinose dehydrogenase
MTHTRRISLRAALVLATILVLVAPHPVRAATVSAVPVRTGVAFPAAFAVDPVGRIFYGERTTGRIHLFTPRTGAERLFFTIPGVPPTGAGEKGLLGLAVPPDYSSRPRVFAFVTRTVNGVDRNQIVRITDSNGTGTQMYVVWSIAATNGHNGGHIAFGPDGMLYAVVGDGTSPANSQNPAVENGKMLRMHAWGAVPADNPVPGSRVFASGIRNSFGFTFDPQTGRLWNTENGPQCNDELNVVSAGRNYGWGPSWTCTTPPRIVTTNRDGADPVLPVASFNPVIAPTGAAFCLRCGLGAESRGALFVGDFNTGVIRRVVLNATRTGVVSVTPVYDHPNGILSVERGPGGSILFSDSGGIYRLQLA